MTPRIRPARPAEAGALHALVRAAYARWVPLIGREPAPMTDDYAARIAAGQAFVLEAPDGRMLGLVVLEEEPDALLLYNIAITPAAQGRRLGWVLMEFVEAEARRRGHGLVRLFTNAAMEANIRLYERLGFVETRRDMEGAFRRVYMEKRPR